MNPRRQSFIRKIVYLVAIAILLMAISLLGRPASTGGKQGQRSPGGILAERREKEGLNQADLGQIDPTSETIKYATLGMRGIAANILWHKATEYKKKKDWTNLSAAVNQIIRVQPNFVSVWRFYGWTLAFNVSVEFDDFHERYRWIIEGIEFLEEGTKHNKHSPRLAWETGWTVNQKIGRSDEKKQFRRLFVKDDDFHGDLPIAERDNWLVGKNWYRKAENKVDFQGDKISGNSPVVFWSSAPMCLMKYANAKEDEGVFADVARHNWQAAHDCWVIGDKKDDAVGFGQRDIATSYGIPIQLNDQEQLLEDAKKVAEELDNVQPGLREKIEQERHKGLTKEQREAHDTDAAERTSEQHQLANQAKEAMKVTHKDLARRIKGPMRKKAVELAKHATELEWKAGVIRRYREIVNFCYWRDRAIVEQEPDALLARESIYDGDTFFADAQIKKALEHYETGLNAWRRLLDKYDGGTGDDGKKRINLLDDDTFVADLVDVIERYRIILGQFDRELPKDFMLQEVLDQHKRNP